jgi:hypothetical protein
MHKVRAAMSWRRGCVRQHSTARAVEEKEHPEACDRAECRARCPPPGVDGPIVPLENTPGVKDMSEIKGARLYVNLSAAQTKRRLQGHGFGVRKVHSNGRNQAVIIHTATGQHEEELKSLFAGVISTERAG